MWRDNQRSIRLATSETLGPKCMAKGDLGAPRSSVRTDARIIDDALWNAVRTEAERGAIGDRGKAVEPTSAKSPAGKPRKKHFLSGLIKCSNCGSNYSISGKDNYRCAGHKKPRTCGNRLTADIPGRVCRRQVKGIAQHRSQSSFKSQSVERLCPLRFSLA